MSAHADHTCADFSPASNGQQRGGFWVRLSLKETQQYLPLGQADQVGGEAGGRTIPSEAQYIVPSRERRRDRQRVDDHDVVRELATAVAIRHHATAGAGRLITLL